MLEADLLQLVAAEQECGTASAGREILAHGYRAALVVDATSNNAPAGSSVSTLDVAATWTSAAAITQTQPYLM
jgi:hypothetical protein